MRSSLHDTGESLISAAPIVVGYRELLERIDAWFSEASGRNPGVIPCHPGCSQCCYGPFDISVADVLLLREGWRQLPEADRQTVAARAAEQVSRMVQLEPGWDTIRGIEALGEEAFDRLSETLGDEPCPMLNPSGQCRVYAFRPLVCRIMGLGIRTPTGREIDNACPIMEQFPLYQALPPELLDLESLEQDEAAYLEASAVEMFGSPLRSGFETTIALAIVQIFSQQDIAGDSSGP